jgi:hypothetical protein
MWFAQPGWKLVYLIAPEAEVPQVIDAVNAAEGIAMPSKNRAYSWLWVQGLTTSEKLEKMGRDGDAINGTARYFGQ